MMDSGHDPSFWDAVRSWADDAGLLLPDGSADDEQPRRVTVPQAVCDSCPICQGAATLDQVNPEVVTDLVEMARSVVTGLASAMTSASDQRGRTGPPEDLGDVPAVTEQDPLPDDHTDPDVPDEGFES